MVQITNFVVHDVDNHYIDQINKYSLFNKFSLLDIYSYFTPKPVIVTFKAEFG